MDPAPISLIMSRKATVDLAHSAMPDAPVVEDRSERPHRAHAPRTRNALAGVLHRVANALAPACEPVDHVPHGAW